MSAVTNRVSSCEGEMRKVSVFNSVSMDGYYTDSNNDMSWAHEGANDPELMEFTKGNAQGTNALVFGRVTYEMMVAWWPTPGASKAMPEVAKGMNEAPKYVFSRTLDKARWSNTTLAEGGSSEGDRADQADAGSGHDSSWARAPSWRNWRRRGSSTKCS